MAQQYQQIIVDIVGWIYFAAWSISFYGQIYTNFKIKSVQGMNFDFVGMNVTGFIFYSIYNTYGYFVQDSQTGRVDLNDVIFTYHALLITMLTLVQIAIYPKKNNKIHFPVVILLLFMWIFAIVYATITIKTQTIKVQARLGVISFLGYFKLAISTLKYLPQLYWNYQRKSTKGWSIFNIIMDMTGGLFSFVQLGLELIFQMSVQINIVKLVLGVMVVFYDLLFIIQHYCLYSQKSTTDITQSNQLIGNNDYYKEEDEQEDQIPQQSKK